MNTPQSHPLAHLPVHRRIDCVLAILAASQLTPADGWTLRDLADLCGCSFQAIAKREQQALAKLRANSHLIEDPRITH